MIGGQERQAELEASCPRRGPDRSRGRTALARDPHVTLEFFHKINASGLPCGLVLGWADLGWAEARQGWARPTWAGLRRGRADLGRPGLR